MGLATEIRDGFKKALEAVEGVNTPEDLHPLDRTALVKVVGDVLFPGETGSLIREAMAPFEDGVPYSTFKGDPELPDVLF